MPPSATGVAAFKVTISFALGGSVEDYGAAAQESIKAVLAKGAKVSISAVKLTLTAGSVLVTAEISFASQAAADTGASALSTGVLKDSASLETALKTQFQADGVPTASLKVEEITTAPGAATASPEVGSNAGGIIGAAGGGGFVALLVIILWMHGKFAPRCPSPLMKATTTTNPHEKMKATTPPDDCQTVEV